MLKTCFLHLWLKVIRYFKVYLKRNTSEKELKYFTYNNKNATNLGKLYFLPKIHKRLFNVPGTPVISNCGTPTKIVSGYLNLLCRTAGPMLKIRLTLKTKSKS